MIKFPTVPKSQLRNKVREIAEFSDNRWQIKKEIIRKHGLSISSEKGPRKMKSIETFLKKRCLSPSGTITNLSKTSSQSSQKLGAKVEPQHECTFEHNHRPCAGVQVLDEERGWSFHGALGPHEPR